MHLRIAPAFALLLTPLALATAAGLRAEPLSGGDEVQMNVFTTSVQEDPAVAAAGDGSFIVVWESAAQDGSNTGVWVRRLAADGLPAGDEVQVNTATVGFQEDAAVAVAGDGSFVVVWESEYQDGVSDSVHAQRFDNTGAPAGTELQVNTFTPGDQDSPSVAAADDGAFVVVWESGNQDASGDSVHAQRFDDAGAPVGDEMMINVFTTADQDDPVVGIDDAGGFVVAWESDVQDGSGDSVQVRRFDSGGMPLSGELQVNTFTTGFQTSPALAVGADGSFVVAWQSEGQDGSGNSVHARLFDAAGDPLGGEIQVNAFTAGNQDTPSVALDPGGGFIVAWESDGPDGDGSGDSVQARYFGSDGTPLGAEFQVNVFTDLAQEDPAVAIDAAGNFAMVWESEGQDGSLDGVYAKRFQVAIFNDGFESGDTTAWSSAVP